MTTRGGLGYKKTRGEQEYDWGSRGLENNKRRTGVLEDNKRSIGVLED